MTESVWFPMVVLFGSMIVSLLLGIPVFVSLGISAIITSLFFIGPNSLINIVLNTWGTMNSESLVTGMLFVLMACILEESGIAEALYEAIHRWMGGLKGGLAIATVVICTLVAAMSGVTTTGVVTMGLIALPIMLKKGYDTSIAIGPILAGGVLGILIPPSLSAIVYGTLTETSVGKLFAGGVVPGIMLASFYMLYIGIRCAIQPQLGPALPPEERGSFKQKLVASKGIILPVLLIVAVLGSMFGGIASPTESSAVGAGGAIVCAAINRRFNWKLMKKSMVNTMAVMGMIMWILFLAFSFAGVFIAAGGSDLAKQFISNLGFSPFMVVLTMMIIFFILGLLLNELTIMVITVPVFLPILIQLGYDPVWFGVLFIVNMQMAYLTPPFAFAAFYLKGIAPPGINLSDIYRASLPFVGLQAIAVILCAAFPQIILWLPSVVFGLK